MNAARKGKAAVRGEGRQSLEILVRCFECGKHTTVPFQPTLKKPASAFKDLLP